MYKIKLDLPNVGKGVLVEVDGLGLFKNGSEHVIDKDQADAFRQRSPQEVTEDGETFWRQGPTLLQAKFPVGVYVETYDAPDDDDDLDDDDDSEGGDE